MLSLSYLREWIAENETALDRRSLRTISMLVFALAPIALRLLLLPWFPAPVPKVHDEFGHLLIADTLNSGRLANPPHPFWRHFESIYVIHKPTYASLYPPGNGAAMAIGIRLFGHPWAGALIITGLFCALTYWALLGWLQPAWALIGGLVATIQYGVLHRWTESYWGGAVASLGGAVVLGVIARLYRRPGPLYGATLVAGWGLIWFTRPYEAAVCAVLLTPVILYPLRRQGLSVLAPAIGVGCMLAALFCYYNYRVTGNAWLMPYKLYQQQYGMPQNFIWQGMVTTPVPSGQTISKVFRWQQNTYIETTSAFIETSASFLRQLWTFYAGYVGVGIPFLVSLSPAVWRHNPLIPKLLAFLALSIAASLLYPFRQAHYLAHFASVFLLLALLALQQISRWHWRSHPLGSIIAVAILSTTWLYKFRPTATDESNWHIDRAAIQSNLEHSGGKHLVFVRYAPKHDFYQEWVYNAADIDRSPVVWAQPIDPAKDAALMRYYADRKAWTLDADAKVRSLFPLKTTTADAIDTF